VERESLEIQKQGPARGAVEAVLDRIRPGLVADGGNVELVAVTADGVVRVEFQGACLDCPAQLATLRIAIEEPLRKAVPGVTAVVPG
jgi:Fe-S cluster biogenesis protein NfuA